MPEHCLAKSITSILDEEFATRGLDSATDGACETIVEVMRWLLANRGATPTRRMLGELVRQIDALVAFEKLGQTEPRQ